MIKSLAKKIIPENYHWQVYNKVRNFSGWRSKSYSAFGEDLVIAQLLQNKKNGFFVDVGAFDPQKYSNTYYLYKYFHFSGINIEPNPKAIERFKRLRPRDTHINMGVAKTQTQLHYFEYEDPLFNTFSEERKKDLEKQGPRLIDEKIIEVKPLTKILDELEISKPIDLLNVDVETLDLEVLESLDFKKYGPQVICIEDHELYLENLTSSKIHSFLKGKGYNLASRCYFTSLYSK